jgi:hypothetical protein
MQSRIYYSIVFILVSGWCMAQTVKQADAGMGIIYNRETTFNARVTTNRGMIMGMEFGRLRTYDKTKFFQFNIGEIKHPKEIRQSANPRGNKAFRPFVFGKQNNLIALRAGWGTKKYFSEKAKQKGVAVGMSYAIGPSLGLVKPYYLALSYTADGIAGFRAVHEKYKESNASIFMDPYRVLGASPFTKGLGEMSFIPGGNASVALHLDWGAFDELVKALEIGVMADVFAKKVPILVSDQNNRQIFVNFFVNLQLGKRR